MITLSPTTLNLFLECPRCFWLEQVRKIHRPRGAFPSLPGGMDSVLKKYFDKYRQQKTLPPEIKDKVTGQLLDDFELLRKWRNNRQGIRWFNEELNAELMGALDDCLVDGKYYIPVDYKTRGWLVKEDSASYYYNQLNCYTLLLEKNGYPHKSFAYLLFYSPKEVKEGGIVEFNIEPVEVKTNTETALKVFTAAVQTLQSSIPKHNNECAFCSYGAVSEN